MKKPAQWRVNLEWGLSVNRCDFVISVYLAIRFLMLHNKNVADD